MINEVKYFVICVFNEAIAFDIGVEVLEKRKLKRDSSPAILNQGNFDV